MKYSNLFVSVQSLTKTYITNIIFKDLTFSLSRKHIVGIVGPNGRGKSTLARIIAGKIPATDGHVSTNGNVGYLPQELHFGESVTIRSYLRNFIESWEDYKIDSILEEVGLANVDTKKLIAHLSGGQQRKIAFAKLLLQEKDILILDEPTNHIDAQTKVWLYERMKNFEGMIILISHDRYLLNEVCDGILELSQDKVVYFDGDYEAYKEQSAVLLKAQEEQFKVYEKRKKKMEEWLARIRQRASVTSSPKLGSLLRNKEKYFEREIINKSVDKPKIEKNVTTTMQGGTHSGKLIAQFSRTMIAREENILINDMNAEIRGAQRIVLQGPNGSGKTTLIEKLYNETLHVEDSTIRIGDNIRVCYVDQHQLALESTHSVLDEFMNKAGGIYTQSTYAKSVLVQFGFKAEQRNTKVSDLSYGQKVRLRFAQISTHAYDLLILDEPTNHLDISTREAIEQALIDYEGALLVVSHDEYFVQQMMIDTIREIEDEQLSVTYA